MSDGQHTAGGLRLRGLGLLLIAIALWGMGPLFVKHFSVYYNPWTQNAFRYSCAAVVLLALGVFQGQLRYRLTRGQWGKLVLVAGANFLMQTNFVLVYYFLYPSVASLVSRLNIVFVIVLSFILFQDERAVIRSPRFLIGSTLALLGVIFVIVGQDPAVLERLAVSNRDFWTGVAIAMGHAFFLSVYFVTIKHAVRDIPALISFTHVAWMTALGLWVPLLIAGGVKDLWRGPAMPLALMILSALLSIVIAHTCYYAALRSVKTVVSVSILQLSPVVVCTLSALVYGDTLSPIQILGGAVVISGAWLAALSQRAQ